MRSCLVGFIGLLIGLIPQLALSASSPLENASSLYHPNRWLWEPVSTLSAESTDVITGPQQHEGRKFSIGNDGAALFRLPGNSWLRLWTDSPNPKSPPALWHSQGNGLFIPARLQQGLQHGEWLMPPPQTTDVIVMLENRDTETENWWLSRATLGTSADIYPYREIDQNEADDTHWYYQRHRGALIKMSTLAAGDEYRAVLTGRGNFDWRPEHWPAANRTGNALWICPFD